MEYWVLISNYANDETKFIGVYSTKSKAIKNFKNNLIKMV